MKFECVKEHLQRAVSKTERVAPKNPTLPVLQNILFELNGNNLKLRATNLDLGIEVNVLVKGSRDGVIAVSGSILLNFLNTVKDKQVIFDFHGNTVVVSTKTTSAVLKTTPTDDFPTLPEVSNETHLTIKRVDLLNGLRSVWYSASVSSIKPELSSIYIHNYQGGLYFVATDSFRLAEKRIQTKVSDDFSSLLLPVKNALEIIKIFEDSEEDISIFSTKNQVGIRANGVYVISRVIDGVFPDYRQIIPKEGTTKVTALKNDVIDALKTATLFSDKFNQVAISVDPKKKICEFQAKNSDLGEGVHSFSATIEGEPITMNFNHKYISDCFSSIPSDSVSFEFNGTHKPLVFKGAGETSFLYLVMPMNR